MPLCGCVCVVKFGKGKVRSGAASVGGRSVSISIQAGRWVVSVVGRWGRHNSRDSMNVLPIDGVQVASMFPLADEKGSLERR